MRALIVMPVGTQRGGSEHQLRQLLEYRREARLEPAVVFLQAGPMVDQCRELGVPATVIDAGRLRQPGMFVRAVRAVRTAAREMGSEVVVGWMPKGQLYGGVAATAARLPCVWLQPGLPRTNAPLDRLATLLPAKLVITVSRGNDRAQRRLVPARRTRLVYPAVDTGRFDVARIGDKYAVRRRLGLPEAGPIFGSVGRLHSGKGFHILLRAAPRVFERHPDATLVIVGGPHVFQPEYADALRDQATRLGFDGRVRMVGHQANPEDWMQAMDVFVHASHNEPFGMVVIEAMALGKPVVAAAEGGPTEVITPEVDGLLFPYGDERALAAEIIRLLSDGHLRTTIGRAATERADDFTVQRFARQFGTAVADAVGP